MITREALEARAKALGFTTMTQPVRAQVWSNMIAEDLSEFEKVQGKRIADANVSAAASAETWTKD